MTAAAAKPSAKPSRAAPPVDPAAEAIARSFVTVTVPKGVKPGRFFPFVGPDGRHYSAMVPQGFTAKQRFQVQVLNGMVFQTQVVRVPDGVSPGTSVAFVGPCGQPRMARIPEGVKPQDTFPVQVPLPQPVAVMVHESATPGDEVIIHAPDGRPRRAKVPEGKTGGDTFMALIDPLPVALPEPLEADELQPWLDAARDFKMNSDFEVPSADVLDKLDFPGLMAAMKTESDGKMTIQALSDKIILSRLLDNMSMPQMPMLLTIQDAAQVTEEVRRFVDLSMHEDGQELIVKPTHLSNAEGVCSIQGANFQSEHKARLVEFLEAHFGTFMNKKAKEFESQALQSLRPGFVVQPKYKSSIGFHMPLEMRIVTLWGKARMGVWWWGMPGTGMPNQRNTWVVRRPLLKSQLSDDDDWEVVHEHPGRNLGFEKALEIATF